MKRVMMIAMLLGMTGLCNAADLTPGGGMGAGNFERMKSQMIDRINRRISHDQEELACVQAANNQADLKVCRDRFRSEMRTDMEQYRQQRGPRR